MKKFLILTALLWAAIPAWSYDFSAVAPSGQTLYYHFDGNGGGVRVVRGPVIPLGGLVIPSSVTYLGSVYPVTEIGDTAFYNCSGLTSIVVSSGNTIYDSRNNCNAIIETATNTLLFGCQTTTIPNSVTSIGSYAFSDCSGLTSVTIGNSVTGIGIHAFSHCSGLTSVAIPNSVTSIGDNAFYNCSGLTSITIPNSVASIGDYAFYRCRGLTSVTIPNSVTSIGDYAFYQCFGLTSVTIPNSVTSIGSYAFSDCSGLTSVSIGNSVASIGNYAFWDCSGLTSIVVSSGNTIYDSRNNCNAIIETATNTLLFGCQTTTIPTSVTSIGIGAFFFCSGLTSITIPNSVTSIGNGAFYGCSGLTSVTIPNSVTSIGSGAFCDCSGLTSVTIPNSVTSIGGSAFRYCSGLDSIVMLPVAPPSGTNNSLFYANNALCYVRCGALAAYQSAVDPYYSARFVEMGAEVNLTLAVNDSLYGSAEIIPQNGQAVQCSDSSAVIQATAAPHYHFDHWSNGRTANPDTLYLEGDSTVTAIFAPDNPGICKVSVQDDRNVVFWNREYEVEQYRVYREGAVAGDYELVATVPYSEPSVWTDEESRPGERRYSYKMTVVDAQGNESPFSEEHKTMHLTIGQGTGNQWNLTWPEYRGAELESYMIYRGTEENDLQLIGQLPAGGAMSYTDEAAPAGTVYYQVAAVMSSPCDIAGIEPLIRSNIAVGEGEDSVGVRDVQAGNLQVWNAGGHIHVSLDGHEVAEYRVYDAIGREVYHATREARTPALPGGVYLVKVAGHPAHKVVVLR